MSGAKNESASKKESPRLQKVHSTAPDGVAPISQMSWDDIRIFEMVVRLGSYRAAEKASGTQINTLRRRVETLEDQLGLTLLNRTPKGVTPTPAGADVVAAAEGMMQPLQHLAKKFGTANARYQGKVRLAISEGIGSFWVLPKVTEFRRRFRDISLDLLMDMDPAEDKIGSVDLMIQYQRPQNNNLIMCRLGYLHAMFFASREYIREHGAPKSNDDLRNHFFVEQRGTQIPSHLVYDVMDEDEVEAARCVMTNASSSHFYSVLQGNGIGILPTYATIVTDALQPLDVDFKVRHEIWLAYTREANSLLRVRRVIEWLKNAFSSQLFPWFAEEFVHPKDFDLSREKQKQLRILRNLEKPHRQPVLRGER